MGRIDRLFDGSNAHLLEPEQHTADKSEFIKALGQGKYTMIDDLFNKCVEYKMKDGVIEIHCKLGLWCVSGKDRQRIELEAKHYWRQYMADGEYAQLLA